MKVRDRRKSGWFWLDNDVVDVIGEHLGPYPLITYVALARITDNSTQAAFPSLSNLAKRVGLSRSTVKRALHLLEECSIVHSEPRLTESGDPDTNEYYLLDRSEWRENRIKQNPGVGSIRPEVGSDRPEVGSEGTEGRVTQDRGVGSIRPPIKTKDDQDLFIETSISASDEAPQKSSSQPGDYAPRTPGSRLLFEIFRRKRWSNLEQRDYFEATEREVGIEAIEGAIRWAAVGNIVNIKSICSAARKQSRKHKGQATSTLPPCPSCTNKDPNFRHQHWRSFKTDDALRAHFFSTLPEEEAEKRAETVGKWWRDQQAMKLREAS